MIEDANAHLKDLIRASTEKVYDLIEGTVTLSDGTAFELEFFKELEAEMEAEAEAETYEGEDGG